MCATPGGSARYRFTGYLPHRWLRGRRLAGGPGTTAMHADHQHFAQTLFGDLSANDLATLVNGLDNVGGSSGLGEGDQSGAPVSGVRFAGDESGLDECVDEASDVAEVTFRAWLRTACVTGPRWCNSQAGGRATGSARAWQGRLYCRTCGWVRRTSVRFLASRRSGRTGGPMAGSPVVSTCCGVEPTAAQAPHPRRSEVCWSA